MFKHDAFNYPKKYMSEKLYKPQLKNKKETIFLAHQNSKGHNPHFVSFCGLNIHFLCASTNLFPMPFFFNAPTSAYDSWAILKWADG